MCTAVSYIGKIHCFGRTLDLDCSYNESVTITPRNYAFSMSNGKVVKSHHAIIGTACVSENYPLYYDGVNEHGLCMAGLNFPGNACYFPPKRNMENIASYELILCVLSLCKSVEEAKEFLKDVNICDAPFSQKLPLTPLHWLVSDKKSSIVAEPLKRGLLVCDNPFGVLTNNPPFHMQSFFVSNYMSLSNKSCENKFSKNLPLDMYSRGMGAMGLPGDWSSSSRFVRASFLRENSPPDLSKEETISHFFHILENVSHPKGCVVTDNDKYQITVYSSCCDTDALKYFYTTYENSAITCVDMNKENLESDHLFSYPMIKKQNIFSQN